MRPDTGYQDRKTVVFLHENAGNIGLRLDYFEILYKKVGVNVLAVGYRGYGRSEGVPSEVGLQLDAKAVAQYVKNSPKIDKKRVFLIGRSLGGGVGIHLLADSKEQVFCGAIIENTWTTMAEMADVLFPFLAVIKSIKNKMLKLNWDNLAKVKKITSPILFITGDLDSFVPTEMTRRLHSACQSSQKELWVVKGGNHNDTFMVAGEEYVTRL